MAKKRSIKITNFSLKSSFFIEAPKFKSFLYKNKSKNIIKPNNEEIQSLNKIISDYEKKIYETKNEGKQNNIIIKPQFFLALKAFERSHNIKTNYGFKVENVINILKSNGIKISLYNIQQKYYEIYQEKMSLMTFSRIMRFHLNKHFLKTTIKNPKLKTNLYRFMSHFFIKGIARSLKLGAKIIFIDETGFQLENNNYRTWRNYNEEILGGAKIKLKERINLLLAVDDQKIIHYNIMNKSLRHDAFIEFLKELVDKIGDKDINNYIFVMDNAKCHLHKDVKKFVTERKLKVLTNCPYLSKFNAIEFVFRAIKTNLYKCLFKNRKRLKDKIVEIMNGDKIKKSIEKIYLDELKRYRDFIIENKEADINEIYLNIN